MYYSPLPIGYSVQWRVCRQSVQCPPYALYAGHRVMAACKLLQRVAILRVFKLLHSCTFRVNPYFDLEPEYIIRKGIRHRIQRCNLRREILSTVLNYRSTERTSRFLDGLAFAGLVWTIYVGTLRTGDNKVTTTTLCSSRYTNWFISSNR